MSRSRNPQAGMSLAEVLVGLAILGVMIYASMAVTQSAHQMTRINNDKEFATQKAISMVEEMKALVQSDTGTNITILDKYDDGIVTQAVLTIQGTKLPVGSTQHATLPDDPISGNIPYGSVWTYERLITVQKLPGQSNDVRLVNVKVFKHTDNGRLLLAEVSTVIRTIVTNMPPSEVYDVYAIAIENVPGWWVYMSNVVPFVKNAVSDLQSRNPGLAFRTHWINTLAYGRDLEYTPYVNNAVDSAQDISSVYFYPGTMPTNGCCGDAYYYPPFFFRGHVRIDGTDANGFDATNNPAPYALADQYNHAMRYYDELALYQRRKAANPNEEMTLRLLLDDMYARPYQYTNALVINLHGELLPLPPVRNYSDAAKEPEGFPNVRVVTHAEQLRYTNSDNVTLRVYSYLSDPSAPRSILSTPITLVISGANGWLPAFGDVKGIHGGVDNDNDGNPDPYDAAPVNIPMCPAAQPTQMCFTAALAQNAVDTEVQLYNSPLRSPLDTATGRGLDYGARLYGLEYIPAPVEDLTAGGVPFSTNLTSPVPLPKNTARWMITIPAGQMTPNAVGSVETRIGNQVTSGTLVPTRDHPSNLSRTYFWRGTDTYIFGDLTTTPPTPAALPISERYQFQGDPRHCPYADLKRPHASGTFPPGPIPAAGSYESRLGMGYNRYFDDFEDSNYNGATSAQILAPVGAAGVVPTYAITSTTRVFALKINGGGTITVSLPTGSLTPSQVANALNSNTSFSGTSSTGAVADVLNNHVRIVTRAKGATVSLQFDTTVNNNCATVFGFDNLRRTSGAWIGWTYTAGGQQYGVKNDGVIGNAGWDSSAGLVDVDVNRYFEMLRGALIRSNAIWTTMTGFSYYYVGLGGEIGYDSANNFPNSVPVSTLPYTGTSGGSQYVDSITNNLGTGVYYVRDNSGTGWWSMPWLGELYPDAAYSTGGIDWKSAGNLAAGNGANRFVRDVRNNYPRYSGTDLTQSVRRTSVRGSTDFFWAGTAAATFHHTYGASPDQGTIQAAGTDIANNYAFPVPNTIDSNRPFDVAANNPSWNPDGFLQGAYAPANTLSVLNTYYTHNSGLQSSALLTNRDSNWNVSFIAVNGLSPTGVSGTTFIAKWSFLSLIQSYLNGGLYSDTSATPKAHHIRQVPRVAITDPNANTDLKDPSSVNVAWSTTWKRWDSKPYTAAYPGGYSETLTMKYAVLYSTTNGLPDSSKGIATGWFYMNDDSTAYPGTKPDTAHEVTGTSYTWSTPAAKFPEGNYLIRVEAYREGYPLHYSFHQYRAYIKR